MYDVDVSPDLITRVTDGVLEELAEWQSRLLDRVYPVIFIDALMIKISDGVVTNRPVYLTIGIDCEATKQVLGLWVGPSHRRISQVLDVACCSSSRAAAWRTCASCAATG